MHASSVREHLQDYGIVHFTDDRYWEWGGKKLTETLPPKAIKQLEKLRSKLFSQKVSPGERLAFYDFIALHLDVLSVIHSMKADAIKASGEAVTNHLLNPTRILDIGSNSGYLTTWYASQFPTAEIYGIDISSTSIDAAKKYAKKINLERVVFLGGSPENIFKENNFHYVIDTQSVWESHNRKRILSWIASATHPEFTFISIPQTGEKDKFVEYVEEISDAGLYVNHFEPVLFKDLGASGGYPLLLVRKQSGESLFNVTESFDKLVAKVERERRSDSPPT